MSQAIQTQVSGSAPSPFATPTPSRGPQEPAMAPTGPAVQGHGQGGATAAAGALFAPMFAEGAAAPQGAPGAGWMSIVPDAQGNGALTSINRSFGANGRITGVALGYGQGVHAASSAGPQVDAACSAVGAARSSLPTRTELHLVNFRQQTRSGAVQLGGYAYQPAHQGQAKPGSLLEWLRTATPQSARNQPAVLKQWEMYKRFLAWEGLPSALNAYDTANVTWGTGFAAGGQLGTVMRKFFDKDPAAQQEFFTAGIALSGSEFVAVDPNKKWKVHGTDAAHLIATDARLLSLFMNIAEGVALHDGDQAHAADHRQAALDAQFETFRANAGNAPQDILTAWPVYSLALAAHAQHFAPAWFNWNGFRSTNGDATAIKAAITRKAGTQAQYIILADAHL